MKDNFSPVFDIKVAQRHMHYLNYSTSKIKTLFPISSDDIEGLDDEAVRGIDSMTSRFERLQDFMGRKLLNLCLERMDEPHETLPLMDKLHLLEKYKIIQSANLWKEFRKIRNYISHEYPLNPQEVADNLNWVYKNITPLLKDLESLIKKIQDR